MEFLDALLGAALLAVCALPFILMGRARNRNKILLIDKMKSMAHEDGGSLTEFDVIGGMAIGMDDLNKRLYLVRNQNGTVESESIPLDGFKKCDIKQLTHEFVNNSESVTVIDRVDFQLVGSQSGKETILNVFDTERTVELRGELQLARDWKIKINNLLK